VDLSTVTTATDLVIGLGDPLVEIIQFDFQASAAAWKHADLMAYNALLFAHYHAPVHTIILLLRPQAAHTNMVLGSGLPKEYQSKTDWLPWQGRSRSDSKWGRPRKKQRSC
jgi:hypothetical protein